MSYKCSINPREQKPTNSLRIYSKCILRFILSPQKQTTIFIIQHIIQTLRSNNTLMMCSFQSTFVNPLQCQVSRVWIHIMHFTCDFTLIFSSSLLRLFQEFSKISRSTFEAQTLLSRASRAYRSLSTHSKLLPLSPQSTKGLRHFNEVLKQSSKAHSTESMFHLVEWSSTQSFCIKTFVKGERPSIRSKEGPFGRMGKGFGRMELQDSKHYSRLAVLAESGFIRAIEPGFS